MIRLTAIKPSAKAIKFTRFADAAKLGMRDAADDAVKDFESTTKTWQTEVTFSAKERSDGYEVGPTGGNVEVYGYVDKGTRAHRIVARRAKRLRFSPGGKAKTSPGRIGSTSGSAGGAPVFVREVMHPGTTARGFSKLIAAKYKAQLQRYISKRIREAM